ncbi:hypothetical protein ACIBCR_15330 [Micromonospora echinospora]|uniref:hypothetical protein n=1 Tax=Micromonospora echinospora TaxID=1877 RepID=UPI0037ABD46B
MTAQPLLWAARHERQPTPAQQAAYNARPHHFLISYNHRWNTGFGNGTLHWGTDLPVFTAADRDDFTEKVALITAANIQAEGAPFDPATLVVEITSVVLLADNQPKEQP